MRAAQSSPSYAGFVPWRVIVLSIAAVGLSAAIAVMVTRFGWLGPTALVASVFVGAAVVVPRAVAFALLIALIVVEPNAFDITAPLSDALYRFPGTVQEALPLAVSPIEALAILTLASLFARRDSTRTARWRRVPWLTAAVPVVIAAGIAYGLTKGAAGGLAYHEARGLLFAIVAFGIAVEMSDAPPRQVMRVLLWGTTTAAVVLLARYFLLTRGGGSSIPPEFAYAHESVLFLASGAALSIALWMDRRQPGRWLLPLHTLLMLAAVVVTGRRSGTLVLLIVAVVLLLLLLRRRPVAGIGAALIAAVFLAGYLGAYWNQEYGAIAQPARAIRSQFEPSLRDASSDDYRTIERASVMATVDSNPVFGVGFGKPFFAVAPLPSLQRFWPLQYYTSHQNVLWLWLKMGFVGISTILGLWMLASARAVRAVWVMPNDGSFPVLPTTLLALFAAYLLFATVDITFTETRSATPLAAALAVALVRLEPWAGQGRRDSVSPGARQ